MGMLNKFLNIMSLDGGYDDEFDDDDYEEERGRQSRKPLPKKEIIRETEEEDREAQIRLKQDKIKPVKTQKVIQMRSVMTKNNMEVCVIHPKSMEDGREIVDTLLNGKAVVLNLEGIPINIAQRLTDFTCGACYSFNGNLQKVTNNIYVVTPEAVEISGDFQDLLSGNGGSGLDLSPFRPE
jgi:cell division inhibitor SepF